ncbi:MAG: sigma-70 family RNA polymerase sigma factor [Pseudomonadota bacterium]
MFNINSKRREFAAVVRAYSAELYRYAYWLSRDRFIAEDLVQETFSRAWTSWGTLRDTRAQKNWLYTILRHEHARLFERKRFDFVADQDLDALEDPRIRTVSLNFELQDVLHDLPTAYREPLLLQVLGGFNCDEIATIMNLTVGATMTRLSRARSALRKATGRRNANEATG